MQQATEIAFLGLGTMGSPMAQNLVQAGFSVKGWNRTQRDRPLVEQADQKGVHVVPTIQEAVAEAQIVCICVSDVQDVKQVIFNDHGVINHAQPETILIDFSTIGPQAAEEIAENLQQFKLHFLDAPVSGGDIGAQNGTLTIMVGGEQADYEQSLPILAALGQNITHCGGVGSGQAVKLCNQVLCAIHMVALCEAMELAKRFNLDPNLMIQVCSTGAAGSWALSNLGAKIVAEDFAPGFMVNHILKDLRLVQACLADRGLPGIALADQTFKLVRDLGGGKQGTQAMIRAYRDIQS
ncbi:MAG: NAD(P)-dependent oxidoreductase [Acaryochloris sp. RU_4_1]|nr:NAD(P)-dependent oxidoreductase [Acaryochloris sp. SU_5_25]NJM65806.1 NAD(P)-dependent oxidoreductase [Acaryochloris sp. RU_4_1]NJR54579.1 NAD(P)-dependent oxidoreductase [Acaryochloris sp. CRU_2_0]